MITVPLRILLVEDNIKDVDLIIYHLQKIVEFPEIRTVENLEDFDRELITLVPDVIISDYNLPTCTGLDIFEHARIVEDTIPFLFLTGAIDDEELAANTILAGANGFVLKKHMDHLDEKLRPLLKKIVFQMGDREEVRDKIRRNKVVVNKVYKYLDKINLDNAEQRDNLEKIKLNMKQTDLENDDE